MRWTRALKSLAVLAAAVMLSASRPTDAIESPVPAQPISAAEQAAVELALVYADGGASAWWPRLAEGSPLRALGEAGAARELEAKLGPPGAMSWELQTLLGDHPPGVAAFKLDHESGTDDLVVLELVEERGEVAATAGPGWALSRLLHWSETIDVMPPKEVARVEHEPPAEVLSAGRRLLGLTGLALGLGLAVAALVLGRSRPRAALLSLGGALASVAVGVLALTVTPGRPGPAAEHEKQTAAASKGTDLARLRQAQQALQVGNTDQAKRLLASFADPSPSPLAEVLRARLALLASDEVATALHYQHAIERLPSVDGLLLEKFQALALSGFGDRARDDLRRLALGGSRNGEVQYLVVRDLLGSGDAARAQSRLRQAWELAPIERGDLLGDPYFAYLVVSGDLFQRLRLGRVQEPTVGSADLGERPVALPPGFVATASGRALRLARGKLEVRVPGGSVLAPPSTVIEDAATRRIREEADALAGLGALKLASKAPTAMAQPVLRQRLEATAMALYRKQRWLDAVELTQAVAADPQRLPTNVVHIRAEALARTYGPAEATRFMLLVAKSQAVERRRDPYALLRLAHLLKEAEQYDLAARVANTAESQLPEPPANSMVPLIHMERQLATAYQVHETRHFRLRYPSEEGAYAALNFGRLLERELSRLKRWIPFEPRERVGIDLFPYQDFLTHYSRGGHAIGLFDGKVRVPFANARGFSPYVVSVLSHEVAHALIAGATEDRAPAWFQEGLAQHIEMSENEANPIADLRRSGKLIAFPLLESIFDSRAHADLERLAYSEAAWAIRGIEGLWGVGGIHRLLAAFKRGLDTEEAIAAAFGLTLAEFDAKVWDWCEHRGPAVWSRPITLYPMGE